MDDLPLPGKIEAILFAHGDPMPQQQLAQLLDLSLPALAQQIELLKQSYQHADRGLMLLTLADHYQLATKPVYRDLIRQALSQGRHQSLSSAAMEVLAIIAYHQPVSKGLIEQIRGVDSTASVGHLLKKGLIEEAGRLELPGHPMSYRTSVHFLRCFGLGQLADLPPIEP